MKTIKITESTIDIAPKATWHQVSLFAPGWFFAIIPHKLSLGLRTTLVPLFMVQVVGGTVADVGYVTALGLLVGVPASILWGNLSDRLHRRRPFLILGFLGFAASTILLGLARSVGEVVAISMAGALLGTAVEPVASALVLDQLPEERWAESFGRFNQIGGWSFVAGLGFGMAWLALLPGWWGAAASMRLLLAFAGVVASLSLLLMLKFLPEPSPVRSHRPFHPALVRRQAVAVVEQALLHPSRLRYYLLHPPFLSDLGHHLKNALGRYFLASLLLFFASAVGFVPFPIFLTDVLGAGSTQVFFIFLIKAATDAACYVPMGRIARRRPGVALLAQASAGRVVIMASFALLALLRPGPAGLVPVTLVHIFTGVTWAAIAVSGTTAVAALAPKGQEGRAMGMYNAVIGLGWILGSLAGGWLAEAKGYSLSFGTAAALMVVLALWFWRLQSSLCAGGDQLPREETEPALAGHARDPAELRQGL